MYFKSSRDLISNIYTFIESRLDKEQGETCEFDDSHDRVEALRFRFDFYLPKGCHALGMAPESVVEVKFNPRADTFYNTLGILKIYRQHVHIRNCYLIYEDTEHCISDKLLTQFDKYIKEGFFIWNVHDFLSKFPTKSSADEFRIVVAERDWKDIRKETIKKARAAIKNCRNTLFYGAGVSASVSMPDWATLLRNLLGKSTSSKYLDSKDYDSLDLAFNHSPLMVARCVRENFTNEEEFKEEMKKVLYENNPRPSSLLFEELVKFIDGNLFECAITFNYDDLLETALLNKNIKCTSVFDNSHRSGKAFPIYHVHGLISQSRPIGSTPVLSEKEYHSLYKEAFHWSNVIQLYSLNYTSCFFVGLSMNDPNLRRLLDIASGGYKGIVDSDRPHYAILERKSLDLINASNPKDERYFQQQEQMMGEFGINIIWFEQGHYDEVPKILKEIRG